MKITGCQRFIIVLGIAAMVIMNTVSAAAFQGPLRVNPVNPRYLTDDSGKAIYFTGSHTWDALIENGSTDPPSPFDFPAYLSFLQQDHHNFLRFRAWIAPYVREGATAPYDYSIPQPWLRTGPGVAWDGKPKFDLSSFNEEYFSRLRQRVIDAGNKGIYAGVNLFEGWWLASQQAGKSNDGWSSHPFRSLNNINGIDTDTNGDGYGYEFYTLNVPPAVIDLQKAYVSKVLDTVNDLDNVLYEIATEAAPDSVMWQYMMIAFVTQEMAARGKTHPVGMSYLYLQASNTDLFNSSADWISPGSDGGYQTNPPAANGAKVIVLDSDHFWGFDQSVDHSSWVWEGFTHGMYVVYMDDPSITTANLEKNRKAMGDTLRYAERMDLNSMLPSTTLCSTAYCLVSPGKTYVVYQPASGRFTLTVTAGMYYYEWFNPNSNSVVQKGIMILAGRSIAFTPPFSGSAVLYLTSLPDTAPPSAPTSLTVTSVTFSQAALVWTAASDNVGVAGYNIYRDGVLTSSVTSTGYTDSGLTPLTTYTYQVSAFDAVGNESSLSAEATVTTLENIPDNIPPLAPSGLTATTVSSSQVILAWTASFDNVGTTGYKIFRDGVQISSVTATGYTDSGLTPLTTYTYQVSAFDAAGNDSLLSTALTVTTLETYIIIDNSTAGTSFTGLWGISGATSPYGSNSLWSRDGATYTWTFTPTVAGNYQLSMWWTQYPSRSSSIPVDIQNAGGTARVTINQLQNGGQWNVLGTYSFLAGASYKITITAQPGPSSTCADATRFAYIPGGNIAPVAVIDSISPNPALPGAAVTFTGHGTDTDGSIVAYEWQSSISGLLGSLNTFTTSTLATGSHTISFRVQDNNNSWSAPATRVLVIGATPPPPDVIIDNSTAGTSFTGLWGISGATSPYGSNSLWSRDGATYTWTFTPTVAGNYQLSMWWTQYPSRSSSIPVDIQNAGGTARVTINQLQNGGQWNVLGTYSFLAGTSYKITITAQPGPSSTCADAVKFSMATTGP